MWKSDIFLISFLLAFSLGLADESKVLNLGKDDFQKTIDENSVFVKFFAPWCGHCTRLAPIWSQLADTLNEGDASRVLIAKVDCTVENDLCSEQDVTGYPTLKFFKKGESEAVKFRGSRDLPALTNFVNEQLGVTKVEGEEESTNDSVPQIPAAGGKLVELTEDTFAKHVASGRHFVKFYAPWCGHCQKLSPVWDELATSLEHDAGVSISKIDCTQFRPICQDFEVKGYPTLLWIEDGKKMEKYSGARSIEDFKLYIEKMAGAKAAKPEEATEKPVSDGDSSVVVELTGTNFEHGIEKGVIFVKYYAPWCGHCKRLQPTWDELAIKFVGKPNVKIAKVDCTLADNKELCSQQEVNGFPTMYIYRNGEKLSEYNGSRSLDDLFDFVTRHSAGHDEL